MSLFKRRGSKYFTVKIKVAGKWRQFKTSLTSKAKAKEYKNRLIAEYVNFDEGKRKGNYLFVEDLLDIYRDKTRREKSEATLRGEKSLINKLKRFFKGYRLEDVTRTVLLDFQEKRLSTVKKNIDGKEVCVSPRTVQSEMVLLQHAFNLAFKDWDLIDFKPFEKVRIVKPARKPKRYLELEEQDLLLEKVDPCYRDLFVLAFDTGLRRTNLKDLEWSWIDFVNRVIRVPETKNKEPISVVMTERVYKTLNRIKNSSSCHIQFVFFNKATGKKFHPDTFTKVARRTADKLGWKDVNFHTSRHSFCSILGIEGASGPAIMDAAGHKDPKTSSHYTNLNLERRRKTIKLLERP